MSVGAGVSVGSVVGVSVGTGVLVGSGVGVSVGIGVLVGSGVGVSVGMGVLVGSCVGASVGTGVSVGINVISGVGGLAGNCVGVSANDESRRISCVGSISDDLELQPNPTVATNNTAICKTAMTKIVPEYSVNMLFTSIAIYISMHKVYFTYHATRRLLVLYARNHFTSIS